MMRHCWIVLLHLAAVVSFAPPGGRRSPARATTRAPHLKLGAAVEDVDLSDAQEEPYELSLPDLAFSHEISDTEHGSKLSVHLGDQELSFETGKIGRQANGAVMLTVGGTILYATVCTEDMPQDIDFAPLRVDYQERMSSAGKTKGGFIKRDGRPSEAEILTARIVDRPLRPMIAAGWTHETQLLIWMLSYDGKVNPQPLAVCAASAALALSDVPLRSSVAAVAVEAQADGKLALNPPRRAEDELLPLQMTLAATKDSVLMIEGNADFLPEDQMLQSVEYAQKAAAAVADGISAWSAQKGKPKRTDTLRKLPEALTTSLKERFGPAARKALSVFGTGDKKKQEAALAEVDDAVKAFYVMEEPSDIASAAPQTITDADGAAERMAMDISKDDVEPLEELVAEDDEEVVDDDGEEEEKVLPSRPTRAGGEGAEKLYSALDVKIALKKLLCDEMRLLSAEDGVRCDGRKTDEVRSLSMETGLLPGPHGSALFTRGETQAICTSTLGDSGAEAKAESVDGMGARRFYLHYTFPPSSVGEVGRVGAPGRRELGHGNLAERALVPAIPGKERWPYVTRVESLITESCGSSSMASVCGGSLALMAAGVPLKENVAGIAMGMLLPEDVKRPTLDDAVILSDILGIEDALGTMDFKTAGTRKGISTFQLDIKCEGLSLEVMAAALRQAREGRLHILDAMDAVQPSPAASMHPSVPRMVFVQIPQEAIGKIIGPGGKTINGLIADNGLENIHISEEGLVTISADADDKCEAAIAAIQKLAGGVDGGGEQQRDASVPTDDMDVPEEGSVLRDCEVVSVKNFGLFAVVDAEQDLQGLVLMKDLDPGYVRNIDATFKVGDKIDVKVLGVSDKNGRLLLSRKKLIEEEGAEKHKLPDDGRELPFSGGPGGGRRGNRGGGGGGGGKTLPRAGGGLKKRAPADDAS